MSMNRDSGDKSSPFWLLGDSNPTRWEEKLNDPLDSRHPARHNILTPILDGVQDAVYRACRLRIDSRKLYIRNAIASAAVKPSGQDQAWDARVQNEVEVLATLLALHRPPILLTFGSFSYEFARRASGHNPGHPHRYWSSDRLGEAFRSAIEQFDPDGLNIIPLLHTTIARGRFLESHAYFTGVSDANYFEFVSEELAKRLIQHIDNPSFLRLWIEAPRRATAG